MIAEIKLFSNKEVSVIELERGDRALSTLICFIDNQQNKVYAYQQILNGLINSHGTWDKEQLVFNTIHFLTLRHSKKDFEHRANILFKKFRRNL
ncbi:hypothetical protein AADZ13_004993 [Bacillus cereus]|nr:hypothetical protein [Bacillus cereus]